MNDFLNRLQAHRTETSAKGAWQKWLDEYSSQGEQLWDATGSASVTASVQAFLKMVPDRLFRSGYVVTAPANPNPRRSSVPGVVATNDYFIAEGAGKQTLWKREGVQVKHLLVERDYSDEGYASTEKFIVLTDGRFAGSLWSSVDNLYEGMSHFIVKNRL